MSDVATTEPDFDRLDRMGVDSRRADRADFKLTGLTDLSAMAIETTLVADLSGSLHSLFDPISDKTLPIYFGPLLGRLYLEGL